MGDVKKPQDHKQKNGAVTVNGVTVTVPAERATDWDVVEGVAVMQASESSEADKVIASVSVLRRLLGDDYERVKSELRAANEGRLTAQDMGEFIQKVFENIDPNS